MKKMLFVLLVMTLCLTGCTKQEQQEDEKINGLVWDCVEYDTIEKMNKAAGTNIVSAAVAGKSDEWFGVISSKIAEYRFKVNDESWFIRASLDVENDISGLYYDNIGFDKDVVGVYYNDDVYVYRFFDNDIQYVIVLDVKDKDIAMSYFNDVCGELQTNITGVKAGQDIEVYIDGDVVVYKVTMYNSDSTTTIMEIDYNFDGDTMVSYKSSVILETEEAAKDYYNELTDNGANANGLTIEGTTIYSIVTDVEFYSDYTKQEFYEMMLSASQQ